MKQASEVRFIGMEPSEALASAAREKAARLERFHPSIMGCRATMVAFAAPPAPDSDQPKDGSS